MLPRATATRTPREGHQRAAVGTHHGNPALDRARTTVGGRSRRSRERSIVLDCDVLQADGGTRTAAITGAYIALSAAIRKLLKFRTLKRSPLRDFVAATSVGIVGGVPMLDLATRKTRRPKSDMNVVMTGAGRYVEFQSTAEKTPFDDEQLAGLIALARQGIAELVSIQRTFEQS